MFEIEAADSMNDAGNRAGSDAAESVRCGPKDSAKPCESTSTAAAMIQTKTSQMSEGRQYAKI